METSGEAFFLYGGWMSACRDRYQNDLSSTTFLSVILWICSESNGMPQLTRPLTVL